MQEYEVFLRGVVPNVKRITAESPKAARVEAERQGFRVRFVKPTRL